MRRQCSLRNVLRYEWNGQQREPEAGSEMGAVTNGRREALETANGMRAGGTRLERAALGVDLRAANRMALLVSARRRSSSCSWLSHASDGRRSSSFCWSAARHLCVRVATSVREFEYNR
nr:hypothetical protein CFP56_07523 [Quercus suber]